MSEEKKEAYISSFNRYVFHYLFCVNC